MEDLDLKIEILGTGCPGCKALEKNVLEVICELGLKADVEKISDIVKIMEYNIMSLPALVVDGKVVSSGKVLDSKEIRKLLGF